MKAGEGMLEIERMFEIKAAELLCNMWAGGGKRGGGSLDWYR